MAENLSNQPAALGLNQVVRMVSNAQKRPDSVLTLRLKGFVLSCEAYVAKTTGETSYNVKFISPELESIIPFYSKVAYEKGKEQTLVFALSGFTARVVDRTAAK